MTEEPAGITAMIMAYAHDEAAMTNGSQHSAGRQFQATFKLVYRINR